MQKNAKVKFTTFDSKHVRSSGVKTGDVTSQLAWGKLPARTKTANKNGLRIFKVSGDSPMILSNWAKKFLNELA